MGNDDQRWHKDSNVVNALIQVSAWIAEPENHMVTSKKGVNIKLAIAPICNNRTIYQVLFYPTCEIEITTKNTGLINFSNSLSPKASSYGWSILRD